MQTYVDPVTGLMISASPAGFVVAQPTIYGSHDPVPDVQVIPHADVEHVVMHGNGCRRFRLVDGRVVRVY